MGFQWVKFVSNAKVGLSLAVNNFASYSALHAIGPVACDCPQCNTVETGIGALQKEPETISERSFCKLGMEL